MIFMNRQLVNTFHDPYDLYELTATGTLWWTGSIMHHEMPARSTFHILVSTWTNLRSQKRCSWLQIYIQPNLAILNWFIPKPAISNNFLCPVGLLNSGIQLNFLQMGYFIIMHPRETNTVLKAPHPQYHSWFPDLIISITVSLNLIGQYTPDQSINWTLALVIGNCNTYD